MEFTREKKGRYKFKGVDNWNNKPISGVIVYQPYDKPLSRAWEVLFGEGTENQERAFCGGSLKACKKWLID